MIKKTYDKRIELRKKLLDIGCCPTIANIISVEAGGSQKIVDIDYLKSIGLKEKFLNQCIKLVQNFYLDELGLI
ncbi:MAG TPA: hypothetical protein DHW42_10460 [Candidatus Marinimicrobia bacterium]|nr:hypothetical protein [Candidatus Neomarinimicrobiota bacterium]